MVRPDASRTPKRLREGSLPCTLDGASRVVVPVIGGAALRLHLKKPIAPTCPRRRKGEGIRKKRISSKRGENGRKIIMD